MARKKNKSQKAPNVSGLSKNANQSKNASEKELIKREVQSYNERNDLLERQMEIDRQKHEGEKRNKEKENELTIEEVTAKLNEAVEKMNVLAESVKSAQQSNENLEMKVVNQSKDHQHELKLIRSKHEEDLARLNTRIGKLEAENKELVERNKRIGENKEKSKLIVKELEIKVNQFSTCNKKLTVDLGAMKDKQEQCLKELDETQAESFKMKEEIEKLNQAAKTNEENLNRLQQEKRGLSEQVKYLEVNLVEVKASLGNEKLLINNLKQQFEELVFKQKRSDEDLISLMKNIKQIDDEKKQTELEIKKVNEKLESQGVEISTRKEQNEKTRKENDRLRKEKENTIEELLQARQKIAKVKRAGFFRRFFKKY